MSYYKYYIISYYYSYYKYYIISYCTDTKAWLRIRAFLVA